MCFTKKVNDMNDIIWFVLKLYSNFDRVTRLQTKKISSALNLLEWSYCYRQLSTSDLQRIRKRQENIDTQYRYRTNETIFPQVKIKHWQKQLFFKIGKSLKKTLQPSATNR